MTVRRAPVVATAAAVAVVTAASGCADPEVAAPSADATLFRAESAMEEEAFVWSENRVPAVGPASPEAIVVAPDRNDTSPHKRIELREVRVPVLLDHLVPDATALGHGQGVALLDYDGDMDLDLFVGGFGADVGGVSPACVYRNDSEPGAIAFSRVPSWCFDGARTGGMGIDYDDDGTHELLALGPSGPERFGAEQPGVRLRPYSEDLPPCAAVSALPFDVDLDGDLDLVAGCIRLSGEATSNTVWVRGDEGYTALGTRDSSRFVSTGFSALLAIGALDVDGDGLLDFIEAEDAFSTEGQRNVSLAHGGVRFRCAPSEDCAYLLAPFAGGVARWGSYMGIGNLRVNGVGEALLIADWGPVRMVAYDGREARDLGAVARGFPTALTEDPLAARFGFISGLFPRFSWGVVVDDFDGDGDDDALITEGPIVATGPFRAHRPYIAVQDADGRFEPVGWGAGFVDPPAYERRSFRAALKADLDFDGQLDLVFAVELGPPAILTVARPAGSRRCTVVPRPRYVPSWGYGYEVTTSAAGRTRWDVQGQSQSGASPWLVAPASAGTVRFPSGFEAAFDCGDGFGPVELVEPEWVVLERRSDGAARARLTADAPGEVTGGAIREDGLESVVEAEGCGWFPTTNDTTHLMLQVGRRWVGRWFELPPVP